jgi:phage N-6-adenine-methyltransferase
MSVHFSSAKHDWETPQDLFDALDAEFHFTLDVCANDCNTKCKRWFTPVTDGLKQPWTGTCWMNPPYGREIGKWMKKAYEESVRGSTVVCLVPARTDTAWWQDYVMRTVEIRYIRGRLKFGGCKNSAPFPSALVIFRPFTPSVTPPSRRRRGGAQESPQ